MKIIITEEQYNILIESNNPCPSGVKTNPLVTLDDLKNGKKIKKGYCNSNPNSAIVKIQTLLQNKGLLDKTTSNGYYGDKTQKAVQKLWNPSQVEGTEIGKKTLELLKTSKQNTTPKKSNNSFDSLSRANKIIVTTLIGEAGGESNAYDAMYAVACVLKNRAKSNFLGYGSTPEEQALAKKQFSMWNSHTVNGKPINHVIDIYKVKKHNQLDNAIKIAKNISSISDVTGGSKYYYTGPKPYWAKNDPKNDTIWVKKIDIGSHTFGNIIKK